MAYQRIRPRKGRLDPLDGFVPGPARPAPGAEEAAPAPKWEPPRGAMTFAAAGIERARDACRSKVHVILREDPCFGKRGYAKEVIADAEHGFLVLVIVFSCKKNGRGEFEELMRPGDHGRRYWRPDKVEFAQ